MNFNPTKINRSSLVKKASRRGVMNANLLSNKALIKTVNRHHINKKLKRVFDRLARRAIFTNNELDRAIELNDLTIDDMKEVAKRRMIKNYGGMSKNELFYTFLKGEKSPQEDTYLKYLKADSKDDLNKRIDHIRLLTAKLGNKVSNIERAEILEDLN